MEGIRFIFFTYVLESNYHIRYRFQRYNAESEQMPDTEATLYMLPSNIHMYAGSVNALYSLNKSCLRIIDDMALQVKTFAKVVMRFSETKLAGHSRKSTFAV